MGKYYFYLSGTSMSTPIVAGVVALILSAHPKLTPDQVKKRIVKTAYSLNQSGNVQGSGQVDAEKAINND
jgi:serine protease AprX